MRPEIQSAMRPMRTVVMHEGRDGRFKMLSDQNERRIEALRHAIKRTYFVGPIDRWRRSAKTPSRSPIMRISNTLRGC